ADQEQQGESIGLQRLFHVFHLVSAYERKGMDMMEEFAFYGSLILRCIIVYFVIIFALRVMGKREVGELSVFDVVIYLVMSELLAISITDVKVSIFRSLVPITVLALLQIVISWVLLKN